MPKAISVHSPWNKGKAVGQKAPFTPEQVYIIRQLLHAEGHLRDLALFKPTVSLGVTSAVVCTYGCGDGRIALTRCAVIDAGLGDRWSRRRACRRPPAAAGSARSALAAGSRPGSPAAPDGFHR